ncbi:GNAT family N-acetyltransferase [Saccharibacter sp. 17.LH.SD]|uniref:GNAT family N-acetyltransferase n=1 Tax=Saccharibacter sp. 17.LH.SD TaxID=2689393 RepID=UPI00136DBB43|nr:GNAT family N-acetyltransferase [Saccharibacter sp. 17.LH.SD]MXV44959.1 GNAT family N-acetyltransferase [Saccharibacter sp. 17.LH.SD]
MNRSDPTITPISLNDCLPLRQKVLWPSLTQEACRVPHDEEGFHYGIFCQNTLVGCASLFLLPSHEIQLRKLAILPDYQGKGLGTLLLKYLLDQARHHGGKRLVLDARLSATKFYEKLHFTTGGSPFFKKDVPFIRMKKVL